ncbi:hypothetical protein IQ265_09335 [Nodosilinea sp. LEGE 06152]|uniref:hypothetical protein n=1 Tax=Nodosilinea sp. LEGE 06152 TaxID=2777966 RepID=UPI0018805179|nr:hypothetical protein [Nodosilinea sp. LEGE 06152]MBE9157026.1 hypothetical protein [Nodosilinea sp. LEGE 06152]
MKPQTLLLATALLLGASSAGLPVAANQTQAAPLLLAQSRAPQRTYMTPQRDPNQIAVDITDAEFRVYGIMQRSYGNFYTLTTRGVQITYNRDTGNVLVVNSMTGTEFYNYTFTEAGRTPSTSARTAAAPSATPRTNLSQIADNQIAAYITEGEFVFDGMLYRTSGNSFIGEDGRVRVMYDKGTSRMVIINVVTGTEFYNYTYSMANEGSL